MHCEGCDTPNRCATTKACRREQADKARRIKERLASRRADDPTNVISIEERRRARKRKK